MLMDHISREMFDEVQKFGFVILALLGLWSVRKISAREDFASHENDRERARSYSAPYRGRGLD